MVRFFGRWRDLKRARLFLLLTACAPVSLYAACSEEPRPAGIPPGDGIPDRGGSGGPCSDGTERPCGVTLGEHDGVLSCYHGTSTCEGGTWAECTGGAVENLSAATADGARQRTLALSQPTTCATNPCDPYCLDYEEQPDGGYHSATDGSIPIYTWQGGTLTGFPGGLLKKGIREPCTTGSDCQLNTYCSAPEDGTCAHSVCVSGESLEQGCDAPEDGCVARVCDSDPTCCKPAPADKCAHDPCARGKALKASCHPCVEDICQVMPECCSTYWSSACADLVSTTCGQTCGCDAGEAEYGGRCYSLHTAAETASGAWWGCLFSESSGDWYLADPPNDGPELAFVAALSAREMWISSWRYITTADTTAFTIFGSTLREYVCEGPPEVMGAGPGAATAWTPQCVDLVASACDAHCDAADPSNAAGQCLPWYPGVTDPTCSGIDLAVGAPCNGSIPVCNHGSEEAPAGIRIVHFPANSNQYPKCDPDQTHPQMRECFTSAPIPPGECIDVTTCMGPTDNNREIMVNPDGTAHVDECSCQDNWSLYDEGTCGPPVCAQGTLVGGATVECNIAFDTTEGIDPTAITVTYVSGSTTTTIPAVSGSDACTASGGYYLDSPTDPTGIVLCPATCTNVGANTSAQVTVAVGCAGTPVTLPATYTEAYAPTCADGTSIQWGFLSYEASTPGDSSVVFRVRAADSEAELSNASYVDIATARSTPADTQSCPMSGSISGCPLDLFTLLGDGAHQEAIELEVTLNPGTNGETATLDNWQITYSCPPSQ